MSGAKQASPIGLSGQPELAVARIYRARMRARWASRKPSRTRDGENRLDGETDGPQLARVGWRDAGECSTAERRGRARRPREYDTRGPTDRARHGGALGRATRPIRWSWPRWHVGHRSTVERETMLVGDGLAMRSASEPTSDCLGGAA
jgi:hypothetical protein